VGAVEIFDGLLHLRIVFEALLEGPHPVAVLLQSLRDEVLPPSTERLSATNYDNWRRGRPIRAQLWRRVCLTIDAVASTASRLCVDNTLV